MRISILVSSILTICGTLAAQSPRALDRARSVRDVPNHLIVQSRLDATDRQVQGIFGSHRAVVERHHDATRTSVIRVDPARRDQIQKDLEQSGLFTFVEPDHLASVNMTPNDPDYPSEWHLPKIDANDAWSLATGSPASPIAMVDSGVDQTHPDLAGKLVAGYNFLNGNTSTSDTMGHGTTTAGAAAAISDNGTGVSGVAWQNPIMPLVVVDSTGYASYSNIASAIMYAADHGARVINISIGGTSPSSALQSAVNYAWDKGAVVFAAAGNGGTTTPYYPANCQNVVAVGATDSNDNRASWSNYGPWISLVAPGVSILTTTRGGGYGYWSGTSYSSPIAAGVAALVLSKDPSLSPAALVNLLEQNTDDIGAAGFDSTFGWGRINAYKAVLAASALNTPPPTVTISSPANSNTVSGTISVQGSATSGVGIASVQLFIDGSLAGSSSASPFSFTWNTTSVANGPHTLVVKASDTLNNTAQASVDVSVNNVVVVVNTQTDPPPPPAPALSGLSVVIQSPDDNTTVSGNKLQITAAALDNVTVTQLSIYVDGILHYTGSVAPYSFNFNMRKLASGSHSITAKAWDVDGHTAESPAVTFTNN